MKCFDNLCVVNLNKSSKHLSHKLLGTSVTCYYFLFLKNFIFITSFITKNAGNYRNTVVLRWKNKSVDAEEMLKFLWWWVFFNKEQYFCFTGVSEVDNFISYYSLCRK